MMLNRTRPCMGCFTNISSLKPHTMVRKLRCGELKTVFPRVTVPMAELGFEPWQSVLSTVLFHSLPLLSIL